MSVAQSPDSRRRPPPLAMASDDSSARARLSLQTMEAYNPPLMGSPGPQIIEYESQSNAPTTPTSTTYSGAAGSPAPFGSAMQSPASTSSRPVSWAGPPPGRRLSNSNPFAGPPGQAPPPYMSPLQSSAASTYSTQSSVYASPVVANFPGQRRDSNADADWRRRTWHPGTYSGPRPATVDLAIIRHPMLIDHHIHHSPLRRKLGSPVSRALIMHLRHQLSPVLHRVPHILKPHNARLRTMLPLSLYQELVIGNA